ncbi:MAG: phosphoadenylyl-sulfate reductase [Deltaproteobacteria bacterium]|nr:phosphoadenylyl-sulfate reductase [Deltaproteobacteria bacterium]
MDKLEYYQKQLKNKTSLEIIQWCAEEFRSEKIAFATSLGIEDQVITHLQAQSEFYPRIFSLDTGRLFQEVYDCIQSTVDRYHIKIEILFPQTSQIDSLYSSYGPNPFYASQELRKLCCDIRKVKPLRKALDGMDAWITGQRKQQSETRQNLGAVEWDSIHGIYKINPLYYWSEEETLNYIKAEKIPYNRLYDRGYRSLGCAPCTRPIGKDDDFRSGRWWWESKNHKECGIHL